MSLLGKIRYIFTREQKIKFIILFVLIFGGALLETLGVALIMPFISVVATPDSIFEQPIMTYIYNLFNMETANQFLILIALVLIVVYVVKNIYLFVMYKLEFRFVYNNQMRLSAKLMDCYLKKSYEYHANKNSAEIVRSVTTDVNQLFQLVLNVVLLITEILVVICVGTVLIVIEPVMTISTIILIAFILFIFIISYRKSLKEAGKKNQINHGAMIKWINQALGGIKEIKVMKREQFFIDSYSDAAIKVAESQRKSSFLTQIPKLFIEAISICAILVVISVMLYSGKDMSEMLPQLSAFAIAAFRIMPSFNRITMYYNAVVFYTPSIDLVYRDLKGNDGKDSTENNVSHDKKIKMKQSDSIKITDISYRYPNTQKYVLDKASFEIPIKKSVAIVGMSGAGKTTFADIVLGLLKPSEGKITVNGINIHENLKEWSKKLGYIPQTIYLCDDTIKNNIAFGIKEDTVDEKKVLTALEKAQLLDFVQSLPDGIHTEIGERGVRLSGGQRQRIGIARAFYNEPEIFVLDEATSALDNDTEAAVMEAINAIKSEKTLIIIAHRLSTIQKCDLIYKVDGGHIYSVKFTEL